MIPDALRRRLRGNDAIWQLIEASTSSAPHACIISGPEGSGKQTAARLLAQALVCTADGDRPCGVCTACRKVEKDIHPDFVTLHRDTKTGYSVDGVRAARQALYILPNEGRHKITVFAEGDDLSPAAQNAMLKMLEEPPAYAVILILCRNPASLLETVRSRCMEIRTEPLPDTALRSLLAERCPDATADALAEAVRSANGSVGAALSFLAGPPETERVAVACCQALVATDEAALYAAYFSAERFTRDDLEAVFGMVATIIGDALAQRTGQAPPALPQFADISGRLRAAFSPARLALLHRQARRAYDNSALYLSPGNLLAATVAEMFAAVTARIK